MRDSGDWERLAEPDPPDDDVAPESDEDVDWASDEVEEPEDGRGARATARRNDRRGKSGDKVERTEHDKWRRWAWAALVFSILGVIWGLTLSTILLNRSGDNTAELISLFEESQERRDALARQTAQNQAEKQAALKATQAESQAYRARSQAARASEAESNASARRALAEATLAGARTRQADRADLRPQATRKEASNGRSSCSERSTGTPTCRGRSSGTSTCCGRSRGASICRGRSTRLATCRKGSRRPSTRCGKRSAI